MEFAEERKDVATTSEDESGDVVYIELERSDESEQMREEEMGHDTSNVERFEGNNSNSSEAEQANYAPTKPGRKTDKQRMENGQKREWSDGEILQLIQLWRDNDILYNTNHPLYYVQTERKLAMEVISNELNILGKDVNDKMHSLRTYYCSQRQRLGDSKHFSSRWKFYDQMSFLYESVTDRAYKSSLNGKSKRKRDIVRSEIVPYNTKSEVSSYITRPEVAPFVTRPDVAPYTIRSNAVAYIHHEDSLHSTSPNRRYDSAYSTSYSNNSPIDDNNGQESPVATRLPNDDSPGRRRITETNNELSTETNDHVNTTSIIARDGNMSSEIKRDASTNHKLLSFNSTDDMFGHLIATSLAQIEDEQEKELLKLNLQTMIYNFRFKNKL